MQRRILKNLKIFLSPSVGFMPGTTLNSNLPPIVVKILLSGKLLTNQRKLHEARTLTNKCFICTFLLKVLKRTQSDSQDIGKQ